MTVEIAIVMVIVAAAAFLFAVEWFSPDVVGLSVLVTLVLTGVLESERAIAGFGSDTFALFLGLLIMSQGLLKTGVVDLFGTFLISLAGERPTRLLFFVIAATALLSAFMSNTAATAFFLPIVFGLAAKVGRSPSEFLLPLAFASILTSSVTLISTSTNIVVSDLLTQQNLAPMGMFELSPVGLPIAAVGILYLWTVGRRLLPAHDPKEHEKLQLAMRAYHTEVIVMPGSRLIGHSLAESKLGRDFDLHVKSILRNNARILRAQPETVLREGDILIVDAEREKVIKVKDRAGIDLKMDVQLPEPGDDEERPVFAEGVLLPGSGLLGRSLQTLRFRQRFDVRVLGIDRAGEQLRAKLSDIRLRAGDVLLMEGAPSALDRLSAGNLVRMLNVLQPARTDYSRAKYAAAIFVCSLALGVMKVIDLPAAALLGAVAMFMTCCITPGEAYRDIEWKALILVGAMLSLGAAMQQTHADDYLAGLIVHGLEGFGPKVVLSAFFVLAVALTQPMSNQAAAIVLIPVAVQTALQLGLNPRTFAMMIAVAASCSYITPLEPACLMVYGPGRYRFKDFLIIGLPLTVLIFGIAIVLVPRVWPL